MRHVLIYELGQEHYCSTNSERPLPRPAFTCSKLTKETLEQGVKYVQS